MFENIDLSKMGKMLEEVQKQASQMQQESESKEFIAKSGGGMVKVSLKGNGEVVGIEIDDSLLEDKESMQILLISAFNDAKKMVDADKQSQATKMFGNFAGFNN